MSRVSAVLLAAGESRRMGEVNKLALLIDAVPMLRRTAQTLLASRLHELVVVIGHKAKVSRELLQGLPLTLVLNEDYAEGQMSSVHKGLNAVSQACDGVMICLSDQPLLQVEDIDTLIEAFAQREQGSILVPTFQGQRGNPIILAYEHRNKILQGKRNLGCKRLIENNPASVTLFEMENDDVVFDLDTPNDYEALKQILAQRGHHMAMP